jgi:hypothetical protein
VRTTTSESALAAFATGLPGTTAHPSSPAVPKLSAEAPVTTQAVRAGLIEQSTRAAGNGFPSRSSSTGPAGPHPAGVTTQGEQI